LKAKGDITVDLSWQQGRLRSFSLTSPVDATVTVSTPLDQKTLHLSAGQTQTVRYAP